MFDLNQEFIDVRDLTERVEELRDERDGYVSGAPDGTETPDPALWRENEPDDAEELETLETILAELAGMGGDHDWEGDWYPITLIRESDFNAYAEQLAEDLHGDAVREAAWPFDCIDWDKAADSLRTDYSSIEIERREYLYR